MPNPALELAVSKTAPCFTTIFKVGGHLAGEHFDEARTVHADGLALVGKSLLGDEAAAFVESADGRDTVAVIEGDEIETLTENENVGDAVSSFSRGWEVVAAGARVGARAGETIEIERKNERSGRIGKFGAVCGALGYRAASAFLNGPARSKQCFAEGNKLRDRKLIFVAILQVAE